MLIHKASSQVLLDIQRMNNFTLQLHAQTKKKVTYLRIDRNVLEFAAETTKVCSFQAIFDAVRLDVLEVFVATGKLKQQDQCQEIASVIF